MRFEDWVANEWPHFLRRFGRIEGIVAFQTVVIIALLGVVISLVV